MRTTSIPRFLPIVAMLLAACGNEQGATPPQPTDTPSANPTPTVAPEPVASATASASASAAASAKPEAPPKRQSSGRPAVLKSDPSEITDTFGSSPPSKLELGDKEIATLKLPEGALRTGTVITFKIDTRGGKSTGGQVGKIYKILAVIPPSGTGENIASDGPPFVLELPAAKGKDVNLAIGAEDDKGKIKWSIVAPSSKDEGRNVAIFELATLPSAWLHVTTKPAGK
jgi:hypothetical protein